MRRKSTRKGKKGSGTSSRDSPKPNIAQKEQEKCIQININDRMELQYNTGLESNRLKAYQPLIKSLQTLSLKNRRLKKDYERKVTDPMFDDVKLR